MKAGVKKPFVAADMSKFAPAWAGVKEVDGEEDDREASDVGRQLARCMGVAVRKKERRFMTLSQWRPAWDMYVPCTLCITCLRCPLSVLLLGTHCLLAPPTS